MHPAFRCWWAFTLHTNDSDELESSVPGFKSTYTTLQAQPKLSHCNKAGTGTSSPVHCTLRREASQIWVAFSKTQIQAGVLSLLYPDREIVTFTLIFVMIFSIIKVTFFRSTVERLEKEDKENNSSLSTDVADVP